MITGVAFKDIKDYIHAHKDNPQAADLAYQYIQNLYPDLPLSKQFAQELVELVQNSNKTGVLFKQLEAIAPFYGTKINPYGFDEKVYADLLLFTKLSCLVEGNSNAEINAYKLAIMFGNSNAAINYIENFEKNNAVLNGQVVFQACLFDLPEGDSWDLNAWRAIFEKKLQDSDFRECGVITHAAKIQKMLEDKKQIRLETPIEVLDLRNSIHALTNQARALEDRVQALNISVKEHYKNNEAIPPGKENELALLRKEQQSINKSKNNLIKKLAKYPPLLADLDVKLLLKSVSDVQYKRSTQAQLAAYLFHKYGVPEIVFEEYLRLQSIAKNSDKAVPQVMIDGAKYGLKDCYLIKLNKDDPKGAVLGHITACCQSLGRPGTASTFHGMVSDNGGFYVLCKGKPPQDGNTSLIEPKNILAQTWAWRGQDGSIVFDSIESQPNIRKIPENENKIIKMYHALAYQLVTEHSVKRVLVGKAQTPDAVGYQASTNPALPIDYNGYRDSTTQQEVADSALPLYTLFQINIDEALARFLALSLEQKSEYDQEVVLKIVLRKATPEQFAAYLKALGVENFSDCINQNDMLYQCINLKNKALIPYLLQQGADANQPANEFNDTPLTAANHRSLDKEMYRLVVDHYSRQILSKSGDVNLHRTNELSLLALAVKAELPERVKELLAAGANFEAHQDLFHKNPSTPEAQEINKLVLEKWLSDQSNPVDMAFPDWSLLIYACQWGDLSLVQKLIERGAYVNFVSNGPGVRTPMQLAIQNGHKDIVDTLLKNGCQVQATDLFVFEIGGDSTFIVKEDTLLQTLLASRTWDAENLTLLLFYAIENDNVKLTKALMSVGARVDMEITYLKDTYSPLSLAANFGSPSVFAYLVKNGANIMDSGIFHNLVEVKNPDDKKSPLAIKIEESKKQNIVRQYLYCLVDKVIPENDINQSIVSSRDKKLNLLEVAASLMNTEYFLYLLENGAKLPSFSNTNIFDYFHVNKEFSLALLQAYLHSENITNDINAIQIYGQSLLSYACQLGDLELVKAFVEKGATIREKDFEYAAQGGNIEVISFLSSKGSFETLPLSVGTAILYGSPEVVSYVLEKGVCIKANDIEFLNSIWRRPLQRTNFAATRDMVLAHYEKQQHPSQVRHQPVTFLQDLTKQSSTQPPAAAREARQADKTRRKPSA